MQGYNVLSFTFLNNDFSIKCGICYIRSVGFLTYLLLFLNVQKNAVFSILLWVFSTVSSSSVSSKHCTCINYEARVVLITINIEQVIKTMQKHCLLKFCLVCFFLFFFFFFKVEHVLFCLIAQHSVISFHLVGIGFFI